MVGREYLQPIFGGAFAHLAYLIRLADRTFEYRSILASWPPGVANLPDGSRMEEERPIQTNEPATESQVPESIIAAVRRLHAKRTALTSGKSSRLANPYLLTTNSSASRTKKTGAFRNGGHFPVIAQ